MKCPTCPGQTNRQWSSGAPARCEECIRKEIEACKKVCKGEPMTRPNLRRRNSTLMAKNFVKRLNEGFILDRTKPGKHKKTVIIAPKVLRRGA